MDFDQWWKSLDRLGRSNLSVKDAARLAWDTKQAEIDRMMLEYCPEEMTPEQTAQWAKHQKPVPE